MEEEEPESSFAESLLIEACVLLFSVLVPVDELLSSEFPVLVDPFVVEPVVEFYPDVWFVLLKLGIIPVKFAIDIPQPV